MSQKYTQVQVKRRKEIVREIEETTKSGKPKKKTYVRFLGVLRYSEQNSDYLRKPKGEDTRTNNQKRKVLWHEVTKVFEVEKVTSGRGLSEEDKEKRTEANIRAALEAWHSEMEEKAKLTEGGAKMVTQYVGEYIDLRERVVVRGTKKTIQASTALDYRKTLKQLEDGFSDIAMGDVTTDCVSDWLEDKQGEGKLSAGAARKCVCLLNQAFKYAVLKHDVSFNPITEVTAPAAGKWHPDSLNQEGMQEVTTKLEAMEEPTAACIAAYISLHAGLRCSEICALKWSDVDVEGQTITVRRSIGRKQGKCYEKPTKSEQPRVVDFDTNHMTEMLQKRRSYMLQKRDNITTDFDSLYIVGTYNGERFSTPSSISSAWRDMLKEWEKDGIELKSEYGRSVNFHLLRHSYCTAQLASGANLKDVQANAGHASAAMTADAYAIALKKGRKLAAQLGGSYMRPNNAEVIEFKTGTDD